MRSRQFNVSPDVSDAFWALARSQNDDMAYTPITADLLADSVLRKYIELKYPKLFEQLKDKKQQVNKLDKQLVEQLTKPNPPT